MADPISATSQRHMNIIHYIPKALLSLFAATLAAAMFASAARAADPEPVATTIAGKVRGSHEGGVFAFLGIPYGGDTAKRRFQAPVPPDPWPRVRDCTDFGPIAPQPAGTAKNAFRHADLPQREDCLNLNLWTPALHDGRKRPVFVYLHGGGVDSQSGDLIDGAALTRGGDAVVVAVNHRLGGFGYLYLGDIGGPEFADSGNAGMLDLVLALQWVHENIAEFGGDPGCVTLFGESGGAFKCATLMAMPAAHGLFHRVWTMSGAGITGGARQQATKTAQAVLAALNLTPDRVAEIKTMPMEKLVAAFAKKPLGPIVDGRALPRDPFYPDASPLSADIPMVIGTTHDEMSSFLVKNPAFSNLTWENVASVLRSANPVALGPSPEKIVAEYRRMYPDYSPTEVAHAVVTVLGLWRGVVTESERRAAQGGPTWVYCLNWPGRGKAAHAIDLALVLNDPAQNWRTHQESTAPKMAEIMSASLLAFGRTGDPNCAGLPPWLRFNVEQRPTMIFDLPPRVENDPRSGERRLLVSKTDSAATDAGETAISPRYAALQPFIGEWSMVLASDADGTPVRIELRFAWLENREGQSFDYWLVRGNERSPQGSGLCVWNPAKRQYMLLETMSNGTLIEGTVSVSGNELEFLFNATKLDGKTDKLRNLYKKVSADVVSCEVSRLNGQGAWEKLADQEFHRKQ
jgi:para-nitrobenzyl esterase